jgi:outer membrane lipoprotein-sorting protein
MVPRRKQIAEGLARLELWIERDTVMLSALLMTFPNGDTKRMTFADVRVNPVIDEALFKPAGR